MEDINQMPETQPIQLISTSESVKDKNIFKILFIVSLFVILGIIIAFYFILNSKINQLNNKQTANITSIPTQTITNNETASTNTPTTIPTTAKTSISPTLTEVDQIKEITAAVNPKNDSGIIIKVEKIVGNYAFGEIHWTEGGGAVWITVKVDNIWKQVFTGQDAISCDIVNQYQIPKEIYQACN